MEKTYVIDIDGTLTIANSGTSYETALPNVEVIRKVNALFSAGSRIIIMTARGMGTFGDVEKAKKRYWLITKDWLERHDVNHHELLFGKPAADHYVDDRALRPNEL